MDHYVESCAASLTDRGRSSIDSRASMLHECGWRWPPALRISPDASTISLTFAGRPPERRHMVTNQFEMSCGRVGAPWLAFKRTCGSRTMGDGCSSPVQELASTTFARCQRAHA